MKNKFGWIVLLLSILYYLLLHSIDFIGENIAMSSLVYIAVSIFLMYLSDRKKENIYLRILNIIIITLAIFGVIMFFMLGGGF